MYTIPVRAFHVYVIFLVLALSTNSANAQSVAGITHVPDTSYTTWSAYNSTRKTHPDIKIVPEFHSKSVAEKRNITYCTTGDRSLVKSDEPWCRVFHQFTE